MTGPLRVLFVTSECTPWSKTGGLADVSAALPAALRALGADVRIMTPAYPSVPVHNAREFAQIPATARFPPARLLASTLPNGVPVLVLDCPPLYARSGGPYQSDDGAPWPDNAQRFAQLCRVAAELGRASTASMWHPDVVHCNDWQAGLVPAYLRFGPTPRAATVLTIHNLAFQGLFPASVIEGIELPAATFSVDGAEFYGQYSFLKAALAYADALTTVSPTYASEIQRAEFGMGLHGLLSQRRDVLTGILNGIDTAAWDPACDPHITRHYDSNRLPAKVENKYALQARVGLPRSDVPLLAMVSRLTDQKGVDLVLEIGAQVTRLPAQLVVLGRGEARYEQSFSALARSDPGHISVTLSFDEPLAHLIEAGADMFLMPSRFEPCGMNQMYSQRYGTLPVVRATGGLVDSVEDFAPAAGTGTGFVFNDATAAALLQAVRSALEVRGNAAQWLRIQRNGMARDFGWNASAARYLEIYTAVAQR
jgi:starch synthase